MSHDLKTVGVALLGVLALSAFAVSAASAGQLKLSGYPGVISGVQTGSGNGLVLEGGRKIECAEVIYSGEYKESEVAEEMASVSAAYKGCTATILGNVTPTTITTNGCTITYSYGTVTDATNATGQMHLRCPAGKKYETHVWKTGAEHTSNAAAFCTYTSGEQTGVGTVTYKYNATHTKLNTSGIYGLKAERSGGTLVNCGAASQNGSFTVQADGTAVKGGETLTGTFS